MSVSTIVGLIIVGIIAGVLSSLIGIGGGIVIVPCLIMFFGLSQQSATGTSLALLTLPLTAFSAYSYHQKGYIDWKIMAVLAIGFIAGSFFGGKVAVDLPTATIKKVFAILMIVVACKYLFIDK